MLTLEKEFNDILKLRSNIKTKIFASRFLEQPFYNELTFKQAYYEARKDYKWLMNNNLTILEAYQLVIGVN